VIEALTPDGALAILRSRVDGAWLDQVLATPDGQALIFGLLDIFVAVDAKDAQDASSLFAQPHSRQVAPPASGAEFATTTLAVTLRRWPKSAVPIVLAAGARAQTRDGHVYALDRPLTFTAGDLGRPKTMTATAVVAGHPGVIPPGQITSWVPVAKGVTGAGLSILVAPSIGQPRALKLTTDLTQPHAFHGAHVGMYACITGVEDTAALSNVGRVLQVASVNTSSTNPAAAADPGDENSVAWGRSVTTTSDARYSGWHLGTFGYTWQILDWDELGLSVTNPEPVVGGRDAILDELASARGRGRLAGEDDEQVRARLARAPEYPSPLGLLRKALVVLGAWGYGRHDVRVYELGQCAPDDVDLYAENFPSAAGFISDLHTTDMDSPLTPDGMCNVGPDYAPLATFVNPGLALVQTAVRRFDVVVSWDFPSSLPSDTVAQIRRLLYCACKAATAPGTLVEFYETSQWGYP
jgi:hypothetical protein